MQIVVYTKSNCINCIQAKALLKSKGMEWQEIDCDNPYKFDGLREKYPEVKQLPQIIIEGQRVGGLAGLQAALKQLNF